MVVYGLIDPRTDCLRYVGKTTNLKKRYSRHCNPQRSDRSHRGCWLRGIRNSGLQPVVVVLEEVAEQDVVDAECFWIASLRAAGADLVNAANGGEGGATRTGHRSTEAHRANIAKAHLGLRPDQATREKMRWTPERREKMEASISRRCAHPRHIAKHGTWAAYGWGCRCDECVAFIRSRSPVKALRSTTQTQRIKVAHESRPPAQRPNTEHGTTTMYGKGCRCDTCRNARAEDVKAQKKRREEGLLLPSGVQKEKLTKRRKRALELAQQHGSVSLAMLARDLDLSPSSLLPVVRALVSEGLLQATGRTRLRTYVLIR